MILSLRVDWKIAFKHSNLWKTRWERRTRDRHRLTGCFNTRGLMFTNWGFGVLETSNVSPLFVKIYMRGIKVVLLELVASFYMLSEFL